MSKSKRNTIDPTEIMASYGADTARWFMLSDSPPDRDVIWTEESVAGANRFVQRVWRLVAEWADSSKPAGGSDAAAEALRKTAHRALAAVEDSLRNLRFNIAVAKIYELVNALGAAVALPAGERPAAAIAESLDLLVVMMSPMMPHLAEECWRTLGHDGPGGDRGLAGPGRRPFDRGHPHPAGPGERKEARRIDNSRQRVPS